MIEKKDWLTELLEILLWIAVFVMGIGAGVFVGRTINERTWQKTTIKRGYAEYNSQTGAWQWKEPEHIEDINS
jgi:Na+(H+)/acetate symporter ActP